jgi:hypothetical protein
MQTPEQFMLFWNILHPSANDPDRRAAYLEFLARRHAYVEVQVYDFAKIYELRKEEHLLWQENQLEQDWPVFDYYYFAVPAGNVTSPEAKQILLDSYPLFYEDNTHFLQRMWFSAQWNPSIIELFGYNTPALSNPNRENIGHYRMQRTAREI